MALKGAIMLKTQIIELLSAAICQIGGKAEDVIITPATSAKFGHYQCNSAMKLAKVLGKSPRDVAQSIVDALDDSIFAKIEIAGPGFINLTIKTDVIQKEALSVAQAPFAHMAHPKKVVMDYSSPNIAKEMHVGHLRSTIIGNALANLFERAGADVLRLNHVGDWGTAFGMLIAFIKRNHAHVIEKKDATLTELVGWYKESKALFDEDADFKKVSQLEVVALQSGDKEALAAWQVICEISEKAYQEIYDLLGIEGLVLRGESWYNPRLAETVAELEQKGLITESDGAKCIFLDGFKGRNDEPLPLIAQKSDGGFNYASTDLAAIKHRLLEEKADEIIILTDLGQAMHFQMVFAVAQKAGWMKSPETAQHAGFGLVLGPDGKKFRTRSGETERLIDLLYGGIAKAKEKLKEKQIPADVNADELAKAVGLNAIKYADLSTNRTQDYAFSYDRMLQFEGNTAPYIMYAYVRTQSILTKVANSTGGTSTSIDHESEINLALQIIKFQEVLEQVMKDLCPHRICEYLFDTANSFNAFFRDCHVDGSDNLPARKALVEATSNVLKTGMEILGLTVVNRM